MLIKYKNNILKKKTHYIVFFLFYQHYVDKIRMIFIKINFFQKKTVEKN